MIRHAVAQVAALALASPASAAMPCLTGPEAEALTAVALPEVIRQTGQVCAAALPQAALVRQTSGPLLAKYQTEADRAWPIAHGALAKLTDPAIAPLLESEFARPFLTSLIVPLIVGRIDVGDCATIERFATLLAPLPARNTAGIVVTALRFLKAEKARRNAAVQNLPDLPICPVK